MKTWREDHPVWAETLTSRLVENSCEPEIWERVSERMMGIIPFETGGATYFKLAMECITSMSFTVSMLLSFKVTKMTVKQFPGENMFKLISFMRGAIQRLTMNKMLPPHMTLVIFQVMQTSSCAKFNIFSQILMPLNNPRPSLRIILWRSLLILCFALPRLSIRPTSKMAAGSALTRRILGSRPL